MTCPYCHESAKFIDYRDSGLHTLLGNGRHDRVDDHCDHCHQGWFPTDEELGIEHPSGLNYLRVSLTQADGLG